MKQHVIIDTLGWSVLLAALSGPIFFPNPWRFAKSYYIIIAILSVLLEIIRVSLAKLFPKVVSFKRPDGSHCQQTVPGCKWANDILSASYVGGMPSGHLAICSMFAAFLLLAYPTVLTFVFGLTCVVIIGMFRYVNKCHRPVQIYAGAAIGILTALLAEEFVCVL